LNTRLENKLIDNYWINKLNSCPTVNDGKLTLLETEEVIINKEALPYFDKLTASNEVVEFTVLLTIYNILLQRYFESIYFIASSDLAKKEQILLYKFNSIDKSTFKECLNRIKEEIQEVFKYSNFNESLVSNNSFCNYTSFGFSYNGNFHNEKNDFPFYLNINNKEEELTLSISYDRNFTTENVVHHFLGNIKSWLVNLESYIHEEVNKLPIISDKEREEVLYSFNNTKVDYPKEKTIVDLFEEQVKKTPNNSAVIFEDKQLTYAELNQQSNQLAQYIRDTYTIHPDDLIGVKLERSEQLLIAILAVLKSGAAYVPIDINYPKERIKYIQEDCNCKVLIDKEELDSFKDRKDEYSIENLKIITKPNHLAYIIYTSGTTGKPKGVMIMHQNAIAMLDWAQKEFDTERFEIVYAATSHCFDLSIYEMFYPLSLGKKIKLLENALTIGEELQQDKKVLINTVPSSIRSLIDSGASLGNATVINLAGEPFPVDIAKKLITTYADIRNLYGPSEDTTYSTTHKLSSKVNYETSIPIGKPISNSYTYILDDNLDPLPIGISGKLYVSGAGVARGYLNNPELTAERFIASPFVKGERMYDTDDLAKWLPDGNIEFLGRKDSQVKIRGYRIELEEIENTIVQFSDAIQQAVLDVKETGKEKELVAYYTSKSEIEKSDLRAFLQERLPSYMVPSYYVALDTMPLTPNGKIDKKALPEITSESLIQKDYVAPRNKTEQELVKIWQDVLGVEKIGITDNFFELGGHSLLVGQIINKIYKQLNRTVKFKTFFETPTIKVLSKGLSNNVYHAIPQTEIKPYYPLTTSQHRIWVLSQLEGGNLAYNMPGAVRLKGDLDISKFEEAFKLLIKRHEILRTNFKVNESGEIHQYIKGENVFEFNLLEKNLTNQTKEEIEKVLEEEHATAFNLEEGLLLRAMLLKTDNQEYIFSLTMHHIISDGWSMELLISEVISPYNNLVQNKPYDLPELEIQYKDYAVWLASELTKKDYKVSEKYWLSQFQGNLPVLDFPSFKNRPKVQTYNGKILNHTFSKSFLEKLKTFSKSKDATLFMTLMSGVNTILYRYTNQNDIIAGTPIAGREHPDLEGQIGLYLNTLAIRSKIEEANSFLDVLEHQKETLLSAYEHQIYPFDELVNKLNIPRDTSRSVLFDVMVVLQNQAQLHSIKTDNNLEGIQVEEYEVNRSTSQFDISFTFAETDELELSIEYNTDIYDDFLIERMFVHFENLMSKAIDNPKDSVLSIEYITDKEKKQLLEEFNNTKVDYPKDKTIVDLFEEQVKKTPNNIAVVFEGKQLTYKELNEQSNQLSQYLRDIYTIQPDDLIGIKLDRSEQLLAAIFGILKSGAAYVPIDVNYPQERINYIEKDSNCKVVIDEKELEKFKAVKNKYTTKNLQKITNPNHLAYVIYTSGTTGNPKGVMVEHRNVSNLISWFSEKFDISESTVSLQLTDISFDPSIEDVFSTLTLGGCYHIISKEILLDNALLRQYLESNGITILNYVPTFLDELLSNYPKINSVKTIISGGEALSEQIKKNLLEKGYYLYNNYGPTEITVDALSSKVSSDSVTLGKPIANAQVYVVSKELLIQPMGVVGELVISGLGVARGYLNQLELSKEKFMPNPFVKGERMYLSGDMACWLPNGELKYLGRTDSQVKIRGNRIELEEIENTIVQFSDAIQQVILDVKETGKEKELVAYYVSKSEIDKSELREFLQARLPSYMVPSYYMVLDTMPLTPNGKVNKKALPEITPEALIQKDYVAPRNKIEKQLVEIWQGVLGIERIGITDNFFELGGHSLKITKLRSLVNRKFNTAISFNDFFIESTIKDQSLKIENTQIFNQNNMNQDEETEFESFSV